MKKGEEFLKRTAAGAKRWLSGVLTASMVLGLLPAAAIPVQAAGTVVYDRAAPEAAILNAQTGTSSGFYQKLKGATDGPADRRGKFYQYNAAPLFGVQYGDTVKNNDSKTFDGYAESTLKQLMAPYDNLQVNVSATFYNRTHSHVHKKFPYRYETKPTSYETISFNMGGCYANRVSGADNDGLSAKQPRNGDYTISADPYQKLYHYKDQAGELRFTKSKIYYKDFEVRVCECDGVSAENILLTFRDLRSPKLANVEYSKDGVNWSRRGSGMRVAAGEELHIKLTYDEPIRFSDDTAAGKENLSLILQPENTSESASFRAALTELSGSSLYFRYQAPTDQALETDILQLSLSDLCDASGGIPLKQVVGSESFSLGSETGNDGTLGFSTTTCYVTDLAGNPLANGAITNPKLTIDTQAPYVKKVDFGASFNNSDVKTALGKTDPTDKDYPDLSDRYLGAGDTLNPKIILNERVNLSRDDVGSGAYAWENAVATTNILVGTADISGSALLGEENGFLTVRSQYFTPWSATDKTATTFYLAQIPILPGMRLPDKEEQIRITGFRFIPGTKTITDLAGNQPPEALTIAANANENGPGLDVTPPEVTGSGYKSEKYTSEEKTLLGFRYSLSIADAVSGVESIPGSFTLSNGMNDAVYEYEYVFSAGGDAGNLTWKTGRTGEAQPFDQMADGFLHIREKAGETYTELGGCTLEIRARDYAGNVCTAALPADGTALPWYIDRTAPSVRAGETSRTLDTEAGIGALETQVIFQDSHGLSQWQYLWTDTQQVPAKDDAGWQPGDNVWTSDSGEVTKSIREEIRAGDVFSKYLWILATDNAQEGNPDCDNNQTEPICLGQYTYDLRKAQYALEYAAPAIKDWAQVTITSQRDDETLIFLVEVPEDVCGTAGRYAALAVNTADGVSGNVLQYEGNKSWHGWMYLTVSQDEAGVYSFRADETYYKTSQDPATGQEHVPISMTDWGLDSGIRSWWTTIRNGRYSGNLNIRVLAGKKDAVTRISVSGVTGDQYPPLTAGNGTYQFSEETMTLRLAGFLRDNLTGVSVTTEDKVGSVSTGYQWNVGDDTLLSTPAGLKFDVTIEKDQYGWDYEDVDWGQSFVLLKNETTQEEYPLTLAKSPTRADGSIRQTVTVPEGSYASGVYTVKLHLAGKVGMALDVRFVKDGKTDIIVDATEPNSDFQLSSVRYILRSPEAYGLKEEYGTEGEWECVNSGEIIYLPVEDALYGIAYTDVNRYSLTITSQNESPRQKLSASGVQNGTGDTGSSVGSYAVLLWNQADASHKIPLYPDDDEQRTLHNVRTYSYSSGFVLDEDQVTERRLYLETDKVNTIFMQKVYANGKTSQIQTLSIQPVTQHIRGQVAAEDGQLIFTPDRVVTETERVYGWAWQNGEDPTAGEGQLVEMQPQADGTWRGALVENGANYQIVTQNRFGSLSDDSFLIQRAPWFTDYGLWGSTYNDGGPDGISFTSEEDGSYQLKFRIRDDVETMKDGLQVKLSFNEDYCDQDFTFTFADGDAYVWEAREASATGVYSVTADKTQWDYTKIPGMNVFYERDYLDVCITGYGMYEPDGTDADAQDRTVNFTVTATDTYGNSSSVQTGDKTVRCVKPAAYDDTAAREEDRPQHVTSGLHLSFTQPVRPAESWAWKEKDAIGYMDSWYGAFPISQNGTHTITFYDLFGRKWSQEVTTNAFTVTRDGETVDYSIDLDFSDTELTGEAVYVSTNVSFGKLLVWERDGNTVTTLTPVDGLPRLATAERVTRLEHNAELNVVCYPGDYTGEYGQERITSLRVYVDNIAKEAPAAELRYYLYSMGQEFTLPQLKQYLAENGEMETAGDVRVWYQTSRHVTPTNGTGSEFTFTAGQDQSHLFTYQDDFGNTGSVEAVLPEGLRLTAAPVPYVDTEAPKVDVDIYAMRFGSYQPEDSFLPEAADMGQKFTDIGLVQGYSLQINASDPSGVAITVSEAEGVSLTGNVLTITKPADFTVTVKDCSENENAVTFSITAEMLDHFDTTAPTAEKAVTATGIYTKRGYIRLQDTDDKGNPADGAVLSTPMNAETVQAGTTDRFDGNYIGWYKLSFTENGTVQLVFYDQVGNRATDSIQISGIDTDPPELKTTWSPSFVYQDQDGRNQYNDRYPTQGPVNTTVTAHVESDKPMAAVSVTIGTEPTIHPLLTDGAAEPDVVVDGQAGPVVRISATPSRITISYLEDFAQDLTITAAAANGKETVTTVSGIGGVIDKQAPKLSWSQEPLTRSGATEPYGVKVTLSAGEDGYFQNYGESGKKYLAGENLEVTFTTNGTYMVRFADLAGNRTSAEIPVSGIDAQAPQLRVGEPVFAGTSATVEVTVDEPCTLKWGDSQSRKVTASGTYALRFTENGTYGIAAVDGAGNEVRKTVVIGQIDGIRPAISFDSTTVYLLEGAGEAELLKALRQGFAARDNMTQEDRLQVDIDTTAVVLTTAGEYEAVYTVTDEAGNAAQARRFVRIIGQKTLCASVDDQLILPNSTAIAAPGTHVLTMNNLPTLSDGTAEPYTVRARKGILSMGQMKYLSGSSIDFGEDGTFTVTESGYYTVLVTTQSRQTVRILLYVEQ